MPTVGGKGIDLLLGFCVFPKPFYSIVLRRRETAAEGGFRLGASAGFPPRRKESRGGFPTGWWRQVLSFSTASGGGKGAGGSA